MSGLAERALRPMIIVVPLVLTKYRGGVPLIDDQEAVEELTAQAADEACGDGLGPRRAPAS